jgi:hypothetical protein
MGSSVFDLEKQYFFQPARHARLPRYLVGKRAFDSVSAKFDEAAPEFQHLVVDPLPACAVPVPVARGSIFPTATGCGLTCVPDPSVITRSRKYARGMWSHEVTRMTEPRLHGPARPHPVNSAFSKVVRACSSRMCCVGHGRLEPLFIKGQIAFRGWRDEQFAVHRIDPPDCKRRAPCRKRPRRRRSRPPVPDRDLARAPRRNSRFAPLAGTAAVRRRPSESAAESEGPLSRPYCRKPSGGYRPAKSSQETAEALGMRTIRFFLGRSRFG